MKQLRRTATALLATVLCLSACKDDAPSSSTSRSTRSAPGATSATSGPSASAAASGAGTSAGTSASASVDGPPTASASASPAPATSSGQTPSPPPKGLPSGDPPNPPPSAPPPASAASSAPPVASSAPAGATGPDIVPEPPVPGSADEVAQQVDDIYAPLKRFRATFKQQYKAKIAGITKDSTGVVVVVRPNKLSFRYDPPNNNRVVSDGSLIRVYEAENAQMFQQPLAATEYPGAFAFIMGKGLRPSFTFTFNDKAKWDGGPVIVGKPREPNPAYDSVLFYIDKALLLQKQPAAIRRVLVTDAQGNRNRFDFVEMSEPGEVSDDEFKFEPPPGTEIIKP